MDYTMNGVVDMQDNLKQPQLEMEKIVNFETKTFCRPFYAFNVESVQEDWPMVKSALEAHNISCSLNTIACLITFTTTATTNPDTIVRAKNVIHLLSIGVRATWALQVLNGRECDIIETQELCRKYGVTADQYVDRCKLLLDSLKKLSIPLGCVAFHCVDTFAAIADSSIRLKAFRIIVENCISGRMKPADHLQKFRMIIATKDLEALRLS